MKAKIKKPRQAWKEQTIPLSKLKPAKYNPRKITAHMFNALKKSLDKFGLPEPIVCNTDYTVIGGHQRLKAAKNLKWKEIQVKMPLKKLSTRECKELNLALNKIEGEWDDGKLAELLDDLHNADEDLDMTGFGDEEIDGIVKGYYEENPSEKEFDENIDTTDKCPKCGYEW